MHDTHSGRACGFSEIISGTIELDRLRRLADRVFAIQMAIEGADFLEVYGYFLERTGNPDQSFENARRVFRGGVITGGAPFTKDVVYLFGLLQVSNAIRAIFSAGRSDRCDCYLWEAGSSGHSRTLRVAAMGL